jgi:hypothetical protein
MTDIDIPQPDTEAIQNKKFERELTSLLNSHSAENGSDTPDFLLAEYLLGCLEVYDQTVSARERWYGRGVEQKPTREGT